MKASKPRIIGMQSHALGHATRRVSVVPARDCAAGESDDEESDGEEDADLGGASYNAADEKFESEVPDPANEREELESLRRQTDTHATSPTDAVRAVPWKMCDADRLTAGTCSSGSSE